MKTRLVVSDLDGSLLDNNKNVPQDFGETLNLLNNEGIQFVIATGRSYYDVKIRLAPWIDRIIVIAENGNHIVYQDKTIYYAALTLKDLKRVVEELQKLKRGLLVLCGLKSSYLVSSCSGEAADIAELDNYYTDLVCVDNIDEIDDAILKITICCVAGTEQNIYPHLKQFESSCNVVISAHDWMDVTKKHEDKGKALSIVQDWFGYHKLETICFGDYLNDLSLAKHVKTSYAMANAHPLVRSTFSEVIGSNDQSGVTAKIRSLFQSQ